MATVVLADDDDDLRAVYAPTLRAMGHDVWEAPGGLEALDLIRQRQPDLLILDVWMPRCNGFEVLERLRHNPLASQMKVLMLSNLGDGDTRLECFEMGASDYVVKGIALSELRDRVDRLLVPPSRDLAASVISAPGSVPVPEPTSPTVPPITDP